MRPSPETSNGVPRGAALDAAYERCERLARAHYENFPVVSRLLSREARRALAAVYAFARAADDLADEAASAADGPTSAERLAALDEWERRLRACARDVPSSDPRQETRREDFVPAARSLPQRSSPETGREVELDGAGSRDRGVRSEGGAAVWRPDPDDADATFLALGDTIRRHGLDLTPFLDLLSAFRQDVSFHRFTSRAELLDYCRRSADPVGRIVLAVHGVRDERCVAWSDRICTALQLANFWQDLAVDREKGRIYLPLEDMRRHGVAEDDLAAPSASAPLRALMLEETAWTRSLFEDGRPLLDDPPAGLGVHLRLVWHGGMRIIELIESSGGDVLSRRPKLGRRDAARLVFRALVGGRRGDAARSPSDVDVGRLTRRSGSSFYYAFLLLPADKRRAIYAVYALARAIDDAVDEAPDPDAARRRLARWREEVARLAEGRPTHAITREVALARERFPIPIDAIEALLEGARMDLEQSRYARWDELRVYCERVASSIGRMCLAIFGYRSPGAARYAEDLGIALQLTNILRDLGQDARRGRLYLPGEDLERHGVAEAEVLGGARSEKVQALLAFEGERARAFFRSAEGALAPCDRKSLLAAEVMRRIYERLLVQIERARFDVFDRRIAVSRPRRAAIALSVLVRTTFARRVPAEWLPAEEASAKVAPAEESSRRRGAP